VKRSEVMEEWHLNRVEQSRVEIRKETDRRNGEEGRGGVRTVTHLQ
jgi:hypothetical protein